MSEVNACSCGSLQLVKELAMCPHYVRGTVFPRTCVAAATPGTIYTLYYIYGMLCIAQKTMIIMYIRMHLSLSTVVTTISFHFISQPLTLAPVLMMPYIMIPSSGCFPVLCSGASNSSALTIDSTFNDDASNDSAFDNGTLNEGTFNGNIHFQRWCFQRQWF